MSSHPDLVPGTVLYTTRITDSGDDVRIERYEVVGNAYGASWVFLLRGLDDADAGEREVQVQTNGRRIYDSTGNYYAKTTEPSLDAHITRVEKRIAELNARLQQAETLRSNLALVRELGKDAPPFAERS